MEILIAITGAADKICFALALITMVMGMNCLRADTEGHRAVHGFKWLVFALVLLSIAIYLKR